MSLALMPRSWAILAAESPFDTVMMSGGSDCGAESVAIGGGAGFISTTGAVFGSTVAGGLDSFVGADFVNAMSG